MLLHSGSPRSAAYEYMFLARTGSGHSADQLTQNGVRGGTSDTENGEGGGNHYGSKGRAASVDQYVHMNLTHPQSAPRTIGDASYDTQIRSYNPNRKLRRNRENYDVFTLE